MNGIIPVTTVVGNTFGTIHPRDLNQLAEQDYSQLSACLIGRIPAPVNCWLPLKHVLPTMPRLICPMELKSKLRGVKRPGSCHPEYLSGRIPAGAI